MSVVFDPLHFSPASAGPMSLVAESGRSVATDFSPVSGRVLSFFVPSQQLCNRGGAVVGPATLILGRQAWLA
jgi:hypothetical protein